MNQPAPIVLFVYNRPVHTEKTIEYLKKNPLASESSLYIFSEYSKNREDEVKVGQVRNYIKSITGFRTVKIIERPYFHGLAQSIISGVSEVLTIEDPVIVIEDDIETAPYFLSYINMALEKYEKDLSIFSVSGFNYPPGMLTIPASYLYDVYLTPRASSWGWATWKNRWEKTDWEVKDFKDFIRNKEKQKEYNSTGKDKSRMLIKQMNGEIDSWAIRWDYTHFKNKAYCLFPVHSLVNNSGADGSGRHTSLTNKYHNNLSNAPDNVFLPDTIKPDPGLIKEFIKISRSGGYVFRIKNFFKEIFGSNREN